MRITFRKKYKHAHTSVAIIPDSTEWRCKESYKSHENVPFIVIRSNKPLTSSPTVHRFLFAIQRCLASLVLLVLACFRSFLLNIGICLWGVLDLQGWYKGQTNTRCCEFQETPDRLALPALPALQVITTAVASGKPTKALASILFMLFIITINTLNTKEAEFNHRHCHCLATALIT